MPIVSEFPPGTPVWADLQTSDRTAAAAFYRALFGWQIPDADPAHGGYAVAELGGTPVAAIGPFPPGMERPVWTVYFAVADLDASAAAATATGGAVLLAPGELMPGVRMAIVADPAGAVLGLWQRDQDSPWLRDEPGAVDWLELAAPDYESTFPFYEAVLGVAVSEMRVNDEPYGLLDVGPANVAGATTAADPSGIFASIKEAAAGAGVVANAFKTNTGLELFAALATDHSIPGMPDPKTLLGEGSREQQLEKFKNAVLERVKSATDLVARKASAGEADAYRKMLADVAEKAADASKEGGFLGFGGVRVSDKEQAFISEVKRAAGVT